MVTALVSLQQLVLQARQVALRHGANDDTKEKSFSWPSGLNRGKRAE